MKLSTALFVTKLFLNLCFIIQAKIARRSLKLDNAMLKFIYKKTLIANQRLKKKLKINWQSVQIRETATRIRINIFTF